MKVKDDVFLPTVLINDGRIMRDNLDKSGFDETWLQKQLKAHKARSAAEIFLLSVDDKGTVVCLPKEGRI